VGVRFHDVEAHVHDVEVRSHDGKAHADVVEFLAHDRTELADRSGACVPCVLGHAHVVGVRCSVRFRQGNDVVARETVEKFFFHDGDEEQNAGSGLSDAAGGRKTVLGASLHVVGLNLRVVGVLSDVGLALSLGVEGFAEEGAVTGVAGEPRAETRGPRAQVGARLADMVSPPRPSQGPWSADLNEAAPAGSSSRNAKGKIRKRLGKEAVHS
jgi:hypothetical protein